MDVSPLEGAARRRRQPEWAPWALQAPQRGVISSPAGQPGLDVLTAGLAKEAKMGVATRAPRGAGRGGAERGAAWRDATRV